MNRDKRMRMDLPEWVIEWVIKGLAGLSDDELRAAIWASLENMTESKIAPLMWKFGLEEAERRGIPI